ncbi:MAG: FMN-binding negative transcriptional regulator [Rhizobiaceae bacterium]|nr:FMN-binding negative transcriptional regulator [Rhizobiaceae bacterium]
MHPNRGFRKAEDQQNIRFAHQRSFGILAVNADNGPLMAHIPFLLSKDGKHLEAHLVRSNPILKLINGGVDAVLAVSGPDSYVSPDWYGIDNQVPTWNYVAVHLRGKLVKLPSDKLPDHLQRLSDNFEKLLAPKPVWRIDKMETDIFNKMLRMIIPIHLEVTSIDGTWKLGQNKPDEVRISAAKEMADNGIGLEFMQLAGLMKNPPC